MKFRMKKAGPALSSILKVSISIFPWRKAIIDKPCITNQWKINFNDNIFKIYLFMISHNLRPLTWNINSRKIHRRWKLRYKCRKVRCSTKLVFPVCKYDIKSRNFKVKNIGNYGNRKTQKRPTLQENSIDFSLVKMPPS